QMRDEIRQLQRRLGITSLYVTHDQTEAMSLSDQVVVMQEGRVEQVGPPEAIYRRPATRFVADFIGTANFVEGVVETVTDGTVTVAALGRRLAVPCAGAEVKPSDAVHLVIRPEAVLIGEPGAGIPGEVRKTTYLGPVVQYEVGAADQVFAAADYNPDRKRIFTEGCPVGVRFMEECFHLLGKR
ncbi:MAG: ABC transporter ATP-binding protein, partial [candidate division NC10 bacterium]|nr:ABC transporter ATP-binding protein [candidate division NC10 bacterium]